MSSRRHTATASGGCKRLFPLVGPRRADLAALLDEDHVGVAPLAVHEVAEALQDLRIVERPLPLALVALDELLHVGLELGADAERILADHLAHVLDAALELLKPHAGALQPVGRADVEHEKAIDVLNQRLAIEIGRQEIGMPRLHAAVAADVEVPALLRGDDAYVLALRLGTLARAA